MTKHQIPKKSVQRILGDGSPRKFFALDDFVAALVADGAIKDADDLIKHPEFHPAIFDAWIRSTQIGCLFAVEIAGKAESPGSPSLLPVVITDPTDTKKLHLHLNKILKAPATPDALTAIFPSIKSVDGIAALITALCEDPAWGWEEVKGEDPDPSKLLLGLRWMLPAGGAASWVLGFSPCDIMPFTRQSPLTAIVFRTQYSKRKPIHGMIDGVHLADLPPYSLDSEGARPDLWDKTSDLKLKLLSEKKEYESAKAKISFVLPIDIKGKLPEPKSYIWIPQPKKK